MATSDSAVAAAAGLGGALIGGLSTFLASRVQWRRESRKVLYADLLTAAHDVRNSLEGTPSAQEANGQARFLTTLDAASLLASWKVQVILNEWRPLAEALGTEDQALDSDEHQETVRKWSTCQSASKKKRSWS
jgi:hypothetical protein